MLISFVLFVMWHPSARNRMDSIVCEKRDAGTCSRSAVPDRRIDTGLWRVTLREPLATPLGPSSSTSVSQRSGGCPDVAPRSDGADWRTRRQQWRCSRKPTYRTRKRPLSTFPCICYNQLRFRFLRSAHVKNWGLVWDIEDSAFYLVISKRGRYLVYLDFV